MTTARAIRAEVGDSNRPAMMISDGSDAPNAATHTSANRICGMAMATSAVRMSSWSASPRVDAASRPHAVPSTSAITTAPPATDSDSRPPYSSRASMSRPSSSVPSQYRADAGAKALAGSGVIGLWWSMTGASRHAATISPNTMMLNGRPRARQVRRRGAARVALIGSSAMLVHPGAWVQRAGEDVHREGHQDEHGAHQQDDGLKYGVVAPEGRLDGQRTQPGDAERV